MKNNKANIRERGQTEEEMIAPLTEEEIEIVKMANEKIIKQILEM
jgi:hypothetical protein